MVKAVLLSEMFLFGRFFRKVFVHCVVATMCFILERFPKKVNKEIWMKSKSVILMIIKYYNCLLLLNNGSGWFTR